MRRLPPLVLVLALAAGGAGAARSTREPPAATPAGPPAQCIPIVLIRESQVRSDDVIDFVMKDRRVFRNTLPGGCPGLGFERRISYTTPLSQLCTADQVTVITTGPVGRGATCALGPFQPVALAKARRR